MNRFLITVFLLFFTLLNSPAQQRTSEQAIPRDTTFTPYLAWKKIKKDHPEAQIVQARLPENVKATYNITYKTIPDSPYGKRDLQLDLFRPRQKGSYPAVLLIHGGGWRSGDRSMQIPMAQQLAAHGYVTAVVEYRLSMEAIYPAGVLDLKAAIRYLRANAKKYHINPHQLALSGSSAGGQLAALVGMTGDLPLYEKDGSPYSCSTHIQAIIDMDGVLDFTDPAESGKDNNPAKPSAGAYWFGATYQQAPELWREASPIQYAGKDTPPILFINSSIPRFHAGRDQLIETISAHGIYSAIHTIDDTPHPFWLFHPWFRPTVNYMVQFLDQTFKQ